MISILHNLPVLAVEVAVRLLGLSVIAVVLVRIIQCLFIRTQVGRVCRQCNYDLRGLSSVICPECGHDVTLSTRRHTRVSIILVMVSLPAAAFLLISDISRLPKYFGDSFLAALVPINEPKANSVGKILRDEFSSRVDSTSFSYSGKQVYLSRMLQALDRRSLLVQVRDQWPADVPMRINIPITHATEERHRLAMERPMLLRYQVAGVVLLEDIITSRRAGGMLVQPSLVWHESTVLVPQPIGENDPVVVDVTLHELESTLSDDGYYEESVGKLLATHRVKRAVAITDAAIDVIEPVSDMAADAQLSRAIACTIVELTGGQYEITLTISHGEWRSDLALGFQIQLVSGNARLNIGDVICQPSVANPSSPRRYRIRLSESMSKTARSILELDNTATLRLYGSAEVALRDFARHKYWAGTLNIPLTK